MYLATVEREAFSQQVQTGVVALELDSLRTVARYLVPQEMTSMTDVDGTLVFGSRDTLLTASPSCELPAP